MKTLIEAARERVGISVPDLAAAVGINESSCWDLLSYETELTCVLSLRQFVRLASVLRVSPFSLLSEQPTPRMNRSLYELAVAVREFCTAHGLTIEQFSDHAGWNVQPFLNKPDTALDEWCLDTLRDVSEAMSLPWPDYFPDINKIA